MADALADAPSRRRPPTDELARVYAPAGPAHAGPRATPASAPGPRRPRLRYLDAVRDALRMALAADDRVVLLGQDIAGYGGVFKATEGLADEFGADRVRNTPIIESGAIGAALGLALDGFRPVVEMQFGDFVTCGFNQLVNNVATTRYRWGAPVPLVVRLPVGGGLGAGPFHSQNVEAWFCHVPGSRWWRPATPADAKGLLLAALDDGNPVLVLEHKRLLPQRPGPGAGRAPRRAARRGPASPGRAATPRSSPTAPASAGRVAAADAVAADGGGEVEVVDLRSLRPVGPRHGPRLRAPHVAGARGLHEAAAHRRLRRRDRRHHRRRRRSPGSTPRSARVGGLDTPIPFAPTLEPSWSAESRLLPGPDALPGVLMRATAVRGSRRTRTRGPG